LQRTIGMAYLGRAHAAIGTPVQVDLRGTLIPATVAPLPFYKRAK
jgi:aminomethyltransferase